MHCISLVPRLCSAENPATPLFFILQVTKVGVEAGNEAKALGLVWYRNWDLGMRLTVHSMRPLAPLGVMFTCLHVDSHVVEITTHTHLVVYRMRVASRLQQTGREKTGKDHLDFRVLNIMFFCRYVL